MGVGCSTSFKRKKETEHTTCNKYVTHVFLNPHHHGSYKIVPSLILIYKVVAHFSKYTGVEKMRCGHWLQHKSAEVTRLSTRQTAGRALCSRTYLV